MRRSEVRATLQLSESHLSHVLHDLVEADLVERVPQGREVALELGPVGREVVQQAVLPAWVQRVADVLDNARTEGAAPPPSETLSAQLVADGAPSRLVAHRLAEAVAGPGTSGVLGSRAEANARRLIEQIRDPQFLAVSQSFARAQERATLAAAATGGTAVLQTAPASSSKTLLFWPRAA